MKNMQTKPKISIVVAVTSKGAAIGNGGKLLFHISDDLKRFKALTKGHPVIMGRKTFESIGRPLPDRTNFVITRNPDYKAANIVTVHSLEEAIEKASSHKSPLTKGAAESPKPGGVPMQDNPPASECSAPFSKGDFPTPEIFIIGGGEIYKQALPYTDKLCLTLVESDATGDAFFPDYWRKDFTKETFREERYDPKTGLKYTWIDLERA